MKRRAKDRKPAKKAAPKKAKAKYPKPAEPTPPVANQPEPMETEGDSLCGKLPACSLPGCGLPACQHSADPPHAASNSCPAYTYPANWLCQVCHAPSTHHEGAAPHPDVTTNCAGFTHVAGQTEASFVGGGGRFGGGGASGTWKLVVGALVIALGFLWSTVAWAQNPCAGMPDETASIQAAVNAGSPVNFEPRLYCVRANTGIRIPSDRTLKGNGATVGILPGCVTSCKAFETVPGSSNVRLENMTVVGDLSPAVGFSIGFRGDSVTNLEVDRVTFRAWRYDGIWLGGNLGTHDARITNVTVEDFGRNGLSIVNGSGFTVDRFTARRSTPVTLLGAGVDVENNPGDLVRDVTITDSLVEDAVVGYYLHGPKGQAWGIRLITSEARRCSRYGVILNATAHSILLDNYVLAPPAAAPGEKVHRLTAWETEKDLVAPIPVGISVGASGLITADDVIVAGNRVEGTTRSAILAGVKDTKVLGNAWVGGSLATVAPSSTVPATAGIQISVP
jgi:hypothetical protein